MKDRIQEYVRARSRPWLALLCFGLAFALGFIALIQSESQDDSRFISVRSSNQVIDLLGWLPATEQTLRGYAVWTEHPTDPLDLQASLKTLAITPSPLALGRSARWQTTTGISGSEITGWAAATGLDATILVGSFESSQVESHLKQAGYDRQTYRTVPIWNAPESVKLDIVLDGDDLRSLNAIALLDDRVVVGISESAVRQVLDAAARTIPAIADQSIVATLSSDSTVSGLVVADQRDLAIECGVGRGWLESDFTESSARSMAIVYRLDPVNSRPTTSVWMQYADELTAEVALPLMQNEWSNGYVNLIGFGSQITNLATTESVVRNGAWVVADLVSGRDNGWVRSGVRYLIAICEESSRLIPADSPVRATPIASPSPVEQP